MKKICRFSMSGKGNETVLRLNFSSNTLLDVTVNELKKNYALENNGKDATFETECFPNSRKYVLKLPLSSYTSGEFNTILDFAESIVDIFMISK